MSAKEKLYLVRGANCWFLPVYANTSWQAIEKVHRWFDKSGRNGEHFNSRNVKWTCDLCDNDEVIQ